MKDRDFLIWIHERLEHVHNEQPLTDYMHKLRSVIKTIPKEQNTVGSIGGSSIEELRERLK